MSYTVVHEHVGQALDVEIARTKGFATVRCSASGSFDVKYPGQWRKFVRARFTVRMFVEPVPTGGPRLRQTGHLETVERTLAAKLTIFTPDGKPFTADRVTLADLQRFRDPRGIPHGLWSFSVEGESEALEEDPRELKVVGGEGEVSLAIDEVITSKSAPPLVADQLDAKTLRRYPFDLYRIGTFIATATSRNPIPSGGVGRELRLLDPDGTVVASGRARIQFDIALPTLAKSRDAQGRSRPWTLEVLPLSSSAPLDSHTIAATVIGSARLHVRALQDRIDRMLGAHGSKLEIFAESPGSEVIARLRIRDAESAETIDMHGLLDHVIDAVPQEPGVDKDIRVGALYTLARRRADLPFDLALALSGVKVGAIDVAIGASERIQPSIPALKIGVQIDGEVKVDIAGIPLATAKVRGGQVRLEAGIALDASGSFVPRTWVNDDVVDIDVDWFTALTAGVLTAGLLLIGAEGVKSRLESRINELIPSILQGVIAKAIAGAPQILAIVLGDHFTHRALRLEGNDIVFEYDAPLEPEPKPDPNYTPIIGRPATQLGPNAWHFVPPTLGDTWAAGNLANIFHIVVVTMENRSFDHVLGYRAKGGGGGAPDGLTPDLIKFLAQKGFPVVALSGVDRIPPNAIGLRTAFPRSVGHEVSDVAQQLAQRLDMPTGAKSARTINSPEGFKDNFGPGAGLLPEDVLGFYEAADLPFSAFLAEQYGYSDRYFCSHPGPTLPNRMLSLTGDFQHDRTGAPILGNNDGDNFALSRATTVYDLLTRLGVSWRVYESFPSVTMLRMFARYATDVTNIVGISRLAADAAAGNLPALTVVEPAMHHFPQSDDHASSNKPAVDMYRGQHFLKTVYDALRVNPAVWRKTLLLITYDEHGGFYDHVVPPLAEARSRPVNAGGTVGGAATGGPAFEVPATVTTPYGVRVPTFVVSPWVPAGKGPDIVLDHCSILKTVLARFCPTRPFLSDRVHASQSFDAFLSAKEPRLQVPPPPALKPLPGAAPPRIVTPPISRKQMRAGNVDYHDLTGMLARMLGR